MSIWGNIPDGAKENILLALEMLGMAALVMAGALLGYACGVPTK